MTCDDVRDRLVERFTERPAPESPNEVDTNSPVGDALTVVDPVLAAHLAGCAACRDEARAIRALAARVRSALVPAASTRQGVVSPPPLEHVLEAVRARARPRRVTRLLLQAAALLAAALLGVTADRALTRGPLPAVPAPTATPGTPPGVTPPSTPPRPAAASSLREALAERPGGLAASLALLDAMSSGAVEPRW